MASLVSFYTADRTGLSFELFPPKTEKGDAALLKHVARLSEFKPDYVTCTYGAGGSTRGKTLDIVSAVKQQFNVPVASHLTCVASTREDLRQYLNDAERRDIDFIVALRGDPPQGATTFEAVEGGLQYANELVELINGEFPNLGIAVAGYPEVHQEAPSADIDLDNLKRKVDCGADIVITQLFYRTEDYFDFCDRCVELPQAFVDRLGEHCDDDDWQFKVGVEFATAQVSELLATGAPGVHFYVLNKSQVTAEVLTQVGWSCE